MYFPQSKAHLFQMAKLTKPRMEENKENTRMFSDRDSEKMNHALSTVQIQSDQYPEEKSTALPNTQFQIDQQPAVKDDSFQNVQMQTARGIGRGEGVPPHSNIHVTDVIPYLGKSNSCHTYDYIWCADVNKRV